MFIFLCTMNYVYQKNSIHINALLFAVAIAFCVKTENDLKNTLFNANKILCNKYRIQLNKKMNKLMVCRKQILFSSA